MIKKKLFIFVNFILLLMFSISISVKAIDNDIIPYNKTLLNQTNTFNGEIVDRTTSLDIGTSEYYDYLLPKYYTLDQRNNNVVDTGNPKLTFITHGLSGSYLNWIKEELFYGSIVDQLNQITSCDFYIETFHINLI